jgi:ankyrin repeat protein
MVAEVVRILPQILDRPDTEGRTPLFRACCLNDEATRREISLLLLEARADPNAWFGRRALREVGPSIPTRRNDINTSTALHEACRRFDAQLCRRLLDASADMNNSLGESPLIAAVATSSRIPSLYDVADQPDSGLQQAQCAVVSLLLERRADPDGRAVDCDGELRFLAPHEGGRSTCFLAARDANPVVLRRLLQAGANPHLRDGNGDCALDVTRFFFYRSTGFERTCLRDCRKLLGDDEVEDEEDEEDESADERPLSDGSSDSSEKMNSGDEEE